jgi:hypothetical protein
MAGVVKAEVNMKKIKSWNTQSMRGAMSRLRLTFLGRMNSTWAKLWEAINR